jgi:hypothetical protein
MTIVIDLDLVAFLSKNVVCYILLSTCTDSSANSVDVFCCFIRCHNLYAPWAVAHKFRAVYLTNICHIWVAILFPTLFWATYHMPRQVTVVK